MKKLLLYLFAAATLVSCAARKTSDKERLSVSILPLRHIVEAITDKDFDITVLVPSGAGPETFEPTIRQYSELSDSRLIFSTGLIAFEQRLLSKFGDAESQEGKIINLSRGIDLLEGSCTHHGEQSNAPHGIDPHIWTSPRALKVMAHNTYAAIHRQYPDSARYTANHERLQQRLTALDSLVAAQIDRSGVRHFVIYHPAMTYYARDYGIEQVAIEHEGKELSAKRMATLIQWARNNDIRCVMYQSQYPRSAVETLTRDIHAEAVEIDPLKEDFIANIEHITRIITGL